MRQTSLEVPPPRPPQALGRSVSFSGSVNGSHVTLPRVPVENALPMAAPMEIRTRSASNISHLDGTHRFNDIKSAISSDYVNNIGQICGLQLDPDSSVPTYISESSAYSSDSSYSTSLMTSSSLGHDVNSMYDQTSLTRNMAFANVHNPRPPVRPSRVSVGSTREFGAHFKHDVDDNTQVFVSKLNKQLVDSYKHIEKLTSDNDALKFKCSALLSRLSETERLYQDKDRECQVLKNMLDMKTKEINDQSNMKPARCTHESSVAMANTTNTSGLKTFTEHLGKVLSEDAVTELNDVLRVCVFVFLYALFRKFLIY